MPSTTRVLSDLKLFARGYARTRIGLFFSLVFPIILILLFGAIFSGGNNGPIGVFVQNQDAGFQGQNMGERFVGALNSTNAVKPIPVDSSFDIKQYILSHSSSAGILIPANFSWNYIMNRPINVTVYSNPADTSGIVVLTVVSGVVNEFNYRAVACSTCTPKV